MGVLDNRKSSIHKGTRCLATSITIIAKKGNFVVPQKIAAEPTFFADQNKARLLDTCLLPWSAVELKRSTCRQRPLIILLFLVFTALVFAACATSVTAKSLKQQYFKDDDDNDTNSDYNNAANNQARSQIKVPLLKKFMLADALLRIAQTASSAAPNSLLQHASTAPPIKTFVGKLRTLWSKDSKQQNLHQQLNDHKGSRPNNNNKGFKFAVRPNRPDLNAASALIGKVGEGTQIQFHSTPVIEVYTKPGKRYMSLEDLDRMHHQHQSYESCSSTEGLKKVAPKTNIGQQGASSSLSTPRIPHPHQQNLKDFVYHRKPATSESRKIDTTTVSKTIKGHSGRMSEKPRGRYVVACISAEKEVRRRIFQLVAGGSSRTKGTRNSTSLGLQSIRQRDDHAESSSSTSTVRTGGQQYQHVDYYRRGEQQGHRHRPSKPPSRIPVFQSRDTALRATTSKAPITHSSSSSNSASREMNVGEKRATGVQLQAETAGANTAGGSCKHEKKGSGAMELDALERAKPATTCAEGLSKVQHIPEDNNRLARRKEVLGEVIIQGESHESAGRNQNQLARFKGQRAGFGSHPSQGEYTTKDDVTSGYQPSGLRKTVGTQKETVDEADRIVSAPPFGHYHCPYCQNRHENNKLASTRASSGRGSREEQDTWRKTDPPPGSTRQNHRKPSRMKSMTSNFQMPHRKPKNYDGSAQESLDKTDEEDGKKLDSYIVNERVLEKPLQQRLYDFPPTKMVRKTTFAGGFAKGGGGAFMKKDFMTRPTCVSDLCHLGLASHLLPPSYHHEEGAWNPETSTLYSTILEPGNLAKMQSPMEMCKPSERFHALKASGGFHSGALVSSSCLAQRVREENPLPGHSQESITRSSSVFSSCNAVYVPSECPASNSLQRNQVSYCPTSSPAGNELPHPYSADYGISHRTVGLSPKTREFGHILSFSGNDTVHTWDSGNTVGLVGLSKVIASSTRASELTSPSSRSEEPHLAQSGHFFSPPPTEWTFSSGNDHTAHSAVSDEARRHGSITLPMEDSSSATVEYKLFRAPAGVLTTCVLLPTPWPLTACYAVGQAETSTASSFDWPTQPRTDDDLLQSCSLEQYLAGIETKEASLKDVYRAPPIKSESSEPTTTRLRKLQNNKSERISKITAVHPSSSTPKRETLHTSITPAIHQTAGSSKKPVSSEEYPDKRLSTISTSKSHYAMKFHLSSFTPSTPTTSRSTYIQKTSWPYSSPASTRTLLETTNKRKQDVTNSNEVPYTFSSSSNRHQTTGSSFVSSSMATTRSTTVTMGTTTTKRESMLKVWSTTSVSSSLASSVTSTTPLSIPRRAGLSAFSSMYQKSLKPSLTETTTKHWTSSPTSTAQSLSRTRGNAASKSSTTSDVYSLRSTSRTPALDSNARTIGTQRFSTAATSAKRYQTTRSTIRSRTSTAREGSTIGQTLKPYVVPDTELDSTTANAADGKALEVADDISDDLITLQRQISELSERLANVDGLNTKDKASSSTRPTSSSSSYSTTSSRLLLSTSASQYSESLRTSDLAAKKKPPSTITADNRRSRTKITRVAGSCT